VTLKNDQNVPKSIEVMVYISFIIQQNMESQLWKAKDLECSQGVTDGRTDDTAHS